MQSLGCKNNARQLTTERNGERLLGGSLDVMYGTTEIRTLIFSRYFHGFFRGNFAHIKSLVDDTKNVQYTQVMGFFQICDVLQNSINDNSK